MARAPILKGLNHSAQGWPDSEGLPWVAAFKILNAEGVEYQFLMRIDATPSEL
jgi:hypothetical protein